MNINPDMVSSALPLSLNEETLGAKGAAAPHLESPRGEVPIIITSHAPDREQSYMSLGGGAEAIPPPVIPTVEQVYYPTSSYTLPVITTCPVNTGGVYCPPAATTTLIASAGADILHQPVTHFDVATGIPYHQQPQQHGVSGMQPQVMHNRGYVPADQLHHDMHHQQQHHERVSPSESTARQGPLTDSMSKFVANDIAEAALNIRPPAYEDESNEKDEATSGAAALTPASTAAGKDADFKKEGHRSGGLHIPSFLRGRRSRRNSLSTDRSELSDAMSSGSNSGDDLSDVEFDEELDKKLKEEVERDLPLSITDLTRAERTNVRKVCLLYNPMSGNKRGRRMARKASRLIEREGVAVESVRLSERGHAEQLCETMDFENFDVVVGVGGDGTFHECINGMMKREAAGRKTVPLALIAAGTGNSFMHELRCFKLKSAIYHILRGVNYPIDICRLTFGDGSSCYSFNSIHWGIASKIMLTAERLRWMGSAMRYTTACFMEIVGGEKAQLAKVVVVDENDKEVEYTDKFIVAIANNIITASKGMKMAPEAKIDDGLIDLLLIKSTSTLNLLDIFRRTYDGSHTDLPYVIYQKVKKFTITPYKENVESGQLEEVEEIIDVDGELKGCTPFTCEVIPRSLRIVL